MNEISSKFKRQIEILGIAIKNTESLGTNDLAQMYNVERLTIKRDLQELRSHGFDIHSEGKKGVKLSRGLDSMRLQRIVSAYLFLSSATTTFDKATALLAKKNGPQSLHTIITLQKCIEDRTVANISYESDESDKLWELAIEPVQFYQAGGMWRLLAVRHATIKQFLLTKIASVTPTDKIFVRPAEERIQELLQNSFLVWTGGDRHVVRLRLCKDVVKRFRARQLSSFETVLERTDGSVEVQGVVNSLDEMAVWIAGHGGKVVAIAPNRLVHKIRNIALACSEAHSKRSFA